MENTAVAVERHNVLKIENESVNVIERTHSRLSKEKDSTQNYEEYTHPTLRQVTYIRFHSCYFNIKSVIAATADIHFKLLSHTYGRLRPDDISDNKYGKDKICLALKNQFNTRFFLHFQWLCKLVRRNAGPREQARRKKIHIQLYLLLLASMKIFSF